ncbi:RHS repeat protein [Dyadobacter sp. CY312]|uniref:RHS repeat protein n=1 Tax=Dyadobacter sp. CY312 TaxID=2907303 RepID=UPI001F2BD080|nr:RHS repeat protein [Dyadobacter sp. CY312]MCE7044326.1 RHS repeat protein [Dyadobacter sp. CY312]
MKRLFVTLFFAFLISCTKENVDPTIPDGSLYQITVNGKLHDSYEYANGLLAKENQYGSCDTPYAIVQYAYENGRLHATESAMRSLYSSSADAMCNPDGDYEKSVRKMEYDSQGRLAKIQLTSTSVAYEYKNDEVIKRYFQDGKATSRVHYMKYDAKGNLIEERTPDPVNGGVVRYEYDNKTNPLQLKEGVHAQSPFRGPNNVIKAFDASGNQLFYRKFTYNAAGLPVDLDEGNGSIFVYHYK